MKYSLHFFILALAVILTVSACGSSVPSPAQPTQDVRTIATPTVAQVAQAAQTAAPALTPSAPQATTTSSRGCNPPAGWSPYTVKRGDTLFALAKQVNLTPEELMRSNCLASSLIGVGDTVFLPMESCTPSPPEGWGTYVVRNGDTLFSLATTRDTTVAEVKQVNCLVSDSLEIGRQLYLPPLEAVVPPPAAPAGAPAGAPAPPSPPSCSAFSCPPTGGDVSSFPVPAGGPNGAAFTSCEYPRSNPWIDPFPPSSFVELGARLYFFMCDFPTGPVKATMTLSDGSSQPVELLRPKLNPDLPPGRAQAVVDWPALPFHPTGPYTLTVVSGSGKPEPFYFHVTQPTAEHILAVPAADPPGTIFRIYYVYFPLTSTQTIDFYGEDQPVTGADHTLSHRNQWQIPITQPLAGTNDKGWAVQTQLESLPGDQPGAYAIRYGFTGVYDVIWLMP
jgi:LysM repeat protein